MACHNHRCWLLLPTKLHISSISAASTCRRMTSTCGGSSVWSTLSFTCLTAGSFFLSTSMTVAELTRKTRTISRTPLPLSVMSTICCFTAGRRPLSWYCKRKMVRGQSRLLHLTVAPKMHSSLASRINSASEGIRRPLEPLVAQLCSVVPHQFGSTSGAHDVFLCFQGLSGVDASLSPRLLASPESLV